MNRMPKASKESAKHEDYGPVESWREEVDGRRSSSCTSSRRSTRPRCSRGCPTTSALPAFRIRRRMARKYVDCGEVPSEMNCTVGIAADSEDELVEAAVQHAVAVHSHEDTEEFRPMIRQSVEETEAAAV